MQKNEIKVPLPYLLQEIDRKILQSGEFDIIYRFFIDSSNQTYLHLWQNEESKKNKKTDFNIERFQLSNETWVFEWKKKGSLKCAQISEDYIPFKSKGSPLMIMQSQKDKEAYQYFYEYLRGLSSENLPELSFIRRAFESN